MKIQNLYLNAELDEGAVRNVQRMVKSGQLLRIRAGMATPLPESDWPALLRSEKPRVLAALFP